MNKHHVKTKDRYTIEQQLRRIHQCIICFLKERGYSMTLLSKLSKWIHIREELDSNNCKLSEISYKSSVIRMCHKERGTPPSGPDQKCTGTLQGAGAKILRLKTNIHRETTVWNMAFKKLN